MEIILMDRDVKLVSRKTYLKRLFSFELEGLTESEKRTFINKRMHEYPEDIFNRSIHLTVSLRLNERGTAFIRYVNAEKSSAGSGDIDDLRDTRFFMTLYNKSRLSVSSAVFQRNIPDQLKKLLAIKYEIPNNAKFKALIEYAL